MRIIQNLVLPMMLTLGIVGGSSVLSRAEDGPNLTVGANWQVGHYCVGEDPDFIEAFTAAVVSGGLRSYEQLMNSPQVPCYDSRMHNAPVIVVTLREKLWDFELPSGEKLTMWFIEDASGTFGYTWLPQKQPQHDQKSA